MSNEQRTTPLIQVKNLYKIFGPKDKQVLKKVKAGESKDAILAETGHTVGLSDINLDIYLVKSLSSWGCQVQVSQH